MEAKGANRIIILQGINIQNTLKVIIPKIIKNLLLRRLEMPWITMPISKKLGKWYKTYTDAKRPGDKTSKNTPGEHLNLKFQKYLRTQKKPTRYSKDRWRVWIC